MPNTVKCPHCQQQIQVDEVLRHDLESQIKQETEQKFRQQLAIKNRQLEDLEKKQQQELVEIKKKAEEQARTAAIVKVREEYDAKIEATKQESEERQKQVKQMQDQIKDLLTELRQSRNKVDEMEIQYQKKLMEDESKIKDKTRKEVEEELTLKMAQKDKLVADLEKQLREAQRKAQQGSQQMQGEVLELKMEEILRSEFPFDDVGEVPKGIRGADIMQTVCTNLGHKCGVILWESKNTKNWSPSWIAKLKNDQRQLKAELAVVVSSVLPDGVDTFGIVNGVWVVGMKDLLSLAHALRQQLIMVHQTRTAHQGKSSKAEIVYDYLISNEFKQRIEVWVEYFNNRRQEIDKEKKYYLTKWDREEKAIFRVMQNTAGIYGDLQGLIGSALPKVQSLELPEEVWKH